MMCFFCNPTVSANVTCCHDMYSISLFFYSSSLTSIFEVTIIPAIISLMTVCKCRWKLCRTNLVIWLTHFVFKVEGSCIDKICVRMFCMFIAASMVDLVIDIIEFNNSSMEQFFRFLTVCISDTMIQSSFINLHMLFSSIIALFTGFSDMFIVLTKFSVNCVDSWYDCGRSYYKLINWCCCLFTHLQMTLILTQQFELVMYDTFGIHKQHCKDTNDKYYKKNHHNDRNIQFCERMRCKSMEYVLMLIVHVICIGYSIDKLITHLYIHFNDTVILDLIKYVLVLYYQQNQAMSSGIFAIDWIVDLILSRLLYLTSGYLLKLILFIHIVHIIFSFGTKLTHSLNISPTHQDIACMNISGDVIVDASCICNCIVMFQEACGSCYKFFDWYCCTLNHLLVRISCISTLKLITYHTIDVVAPNFKIINDKHDKHSCQNGRSNQHDENMYCALM